MTTQIDNLSLSFNEILYNIGDLFDDLYTDKTANLVLPNNNKQVDKLNTSIKTFDKNLDDILIQLSDISLFETKLKERAIEREQQKNIPAKEVSTQEDKATENQDTEDHAANSNKNFGSSENILDDITDFLSTVPDSADVNLSGEFNDNIQDLLMENNPYNDPNNDNSMNFDFQNNNNNQYDNNSNDNNNNINSNGNNNGEMSDINLEFDNNIFSEIDSMLNI